MDAGIAAAPAENAQCGRDPSTGRGRAAGGTSGGRRGVDAESGLAHRFPPPAHTSDVEVAPALLHGAGGRGARRRGLPGRRPGGEPGRGRAVAGGAAAGAAAAGRVGPEAAAGKRKASARAEVEHPFPYGKRHFGCAKVRCRRLARNMQRTALLPGCAKVRIAGRCATG